MIELLKSGRVDNSLLCELAVHPDFPRLMADLEIYVNGIAGKQVQSANAIVDAVSTTIMKQHNPGLTDPQLRQLIAAHIDDDSFCRYVIQQDINKIALDLREAHKDDFFSVPEDNPLEDFLQTAEETAKEDSDPEQASLAFICKRLKLNYKKLSEEEKKWLKKIAQKSDSFFKFNLSRLQINASDACSGSLPSLAVSSAVCKKSSNGLSSGTLKKSSLCVSRRSRAILFMSCCIHSSKVIECKIIVGSDKLFLSSGVGKATAS